MFLSFVAIKKTSRAGPEGCLRRGQVQVRKILKRLNERGTTVERGYFWRRAFWLLAAIVMLAAMLPQVGRSQPTGMQPEAEKLLRHMSDYRASRQQFTATAESTLICSSTLPTTLPDYMTLFVRIGKIDGLGTTLNA